MANGMYNRAREAMGFRVERRKKVMPESTMGVYCTENCQVGTGNERISDIHQHVLETGHVVYRIKEVLTEWVRVDSAGRLV